MVVVVEEQERSLGQEPLDPNEILVAEFNYIASTAFQTNEDRARVSNYYRRPSAVAWPSCWHSQSCWWMLVLLCQASPSWGWE